MRAIVVFLLCISGLVSSGCVTMMHSIIHPHSTVEAPTFCFYNGSALEQHAEPVGIYQFRVVLLKNKNVNEGRLEWDQRSQDYDQIAWFIEYTPDGDDFLDRGRKKDEVPTKPLPCIVYGKTPPGYTAHIPAQPLIPNRFYAVGLQNNTSMGLEQGPYFIIRADSTGRPIQLEYQETFPSSYRPFEKFKDFTKFRVIRREQE